MKRALLYMKSFCFFAELERRVDHLDHKVLSLGFGLYYLENRVEDLEDLANITSENIVYL